MEGSGHQRHCTKSFPKPFRTTTIVAEDSYPQYRRRSRQEGGRMIVKKVNGEDVEVDNSFIVPYNLFLGAATGSPYIVFIWTSGV